VVLFDRRPCPDSLFSHEEKVAKIMGKICQHASLLLWNRNDSSGNTTELRVLGCHGVRVTFRPTLIEGYF